MENWHNYLGPKGERGDKGDKGQAGDPGLSVTSSQTVSAARTDGENLLISSDGTYSKTHHYILCFHF